MWYFVLFGVFALEIVNSNNSDICRINVSA